jgi:hypothetical protein
MDALPAGATCKYTSTSAFGAVLVTNGPVVRDGYYHAAPFREWMRENVHALMKARPEVRDFGVRVITSTYSTRECNIAGWATGGVEVAVGLKAAGAAVSPVGNHRVKMDDMCRSFQAGEDKRERLVVFADGVNFTFYKLLVGLPSCCAVVCVARAEPSGSRAL